jgi:DNA-binding transcriptional ArsR family regulator
MASRQAVRRTVPAGASSTADVCEAQCVDPRKVASARRKARPAESIHLVADTFRVLGDPTRLQIVDALARAELCVCDLALIVGASQSTVSHSLRALRQMRLVRYRKDGKIAYYSLDDEHIGRLLTLAFDHANETV